MELTINVNMDRSCRFCRKKGAETKSSICLGCVANIIKSGIHPETVLKAVNIVRAERSVSVEQLQRTLELDRHLVRRLLYCLRDLKVVKKADGKWELRR